jgi:hypothetical protein
MELNPDYTNVVGIIAPRIPNTEDARIRIVGINQLKFTEFSKEASRNMFPPHGFVRAYHFFDNYPSLEEKDLIQFNCTINERFQSGWDVYKMSSKPQKKGGLIFSVEDIVCDRGYVDLLTLVHKIPERKSAFYLLAEDKYVISKLTIKNGQLVPPPAGYLQLWDRSECTIVTGEGQDYLVEEPTAMPRLIDCSPMEKLFERFRSQLRELHFETISHLDQNTTWRKDILKLLNDGTDPRLVKIRAERLSNAFDQLELSLTETKQIIESSEKFADRFTAALETFKEEFLQQNFKEKSRLEAEARQEQSRLNNELDKIQRKIKATKSEHEKLDKQMAETRSALDHLNQNKDRLLADFRLFSDIPLSPPPSLPNPTGHLPSFLLEELSPPPDAVLLTREQLIERLQFFFRQRQLDDGMAAGALDIFLLYPAVFIPHPKVALALIHAFGNARYIIQQTGPNWLDFTSLWQNGLGTIWEAASKDPGKLHVLMLEDLNLSSPECYARPLLDIIDGTRSKIPCAGTCFPPNLRILATKATSSNPAIGLPLYHQTFVQWGHFGFNPPVGTKASAQPGSTSFFIPAAILADPLVNGSVDTQMLRTLFPPDWQVFAIKTQLATETPQLFDEP